MKTKLRLKYSPEVMKMRFVCFLALLFASSPLLSQSAPSGATMSADIEVPAGARLVLAARGTGNQIYVCALHDQTAIWQFQAPEAKLEDEFGKQIGVHAAGPSWRLSDSSEIKGSVIGSKPSPDADSIPWLLLRVVSHNGAGQLSKVEYVRRTDTKGGAMPKGGCDSQHAGAQIRIPYSARYSFYTKD